MEKKNIYLAKVTSALNGWNYMSYKGLSKKSQNISEKVQSESFSSIKITDFFSGELGVCSIHKKRIILPYFSAASAIKKELDEKRELFILYPPAFSNTIIKATEGLDEIADTYDITKEVKLYESLIKKGKEYSERYLKRHKTNVGTNALEERIFYHFMSEYYSSQKQPHLLSELNDWLNPAVMIENKSSNKKKEQKNKSESEEKISTPILFALFAINDAYGSKEKVIKTMEEMSISEEFINKILYC